VPLVSQKRSFVRRTADLWLIDDDGDGPLGFPSRGQARTFRSRPCVWCLVYRADVPLHCYGLDVTNQENITDRAAREAER
jgi:hypothetical protein